MAAEVSEYSDYDLIISFNVHGSIDGRDLMYDTDGTIKIAEKRIFDVPTDCNVTFLIAAQCGVSNFIDDNATWTHLLRTSIQKELHKHSSKDLAERLQPVLLKENKRLEKQDTKDDGMQKWSTYMDTAWKIVKTNRYYNKMYNVDPLDKIPEPFVVYYCRYPDSSVTKEKVQEAILEWVEPSEMDAQRNVSRKTLIDILTGTLFGFKNILIIDASCSDFEYGSERDARYTNRLMRKDGLSGGKRTRRKKRRKNKTSTDFSVNRKHKRFTINR